MMVTDKATIIGAFWRIAGRMMGPQ